MTERGPGAARRSIAPCTSCAPASGTGRHHTRKWESTEPWGPSVSSYAIDDGRRLLLFDPLAVPDELVALTTGRETAIVLTCPWHERDTQGLVAQIDAPVYAPRPDTAEDLMAVYGLSAEQTAGSSRDALPLRWGKLAPFDAWRTFRK